jgi:hypothetical protein
MKVVQVLAYRIDAVPGHITVSRRGEGCNLRVALCRAVGDILLDDKLKHKQIGELKLSVVVVKNDKITSPSDSTQV